MSAVVSPLSDGGGAARQAYLHDPNLYLRPLQADDAKRSVVWRDSPFPVSPARAAALLEDETPDDPDLAPLVLVACQAETGEAIGAVRIRFRDRIIAELSLLIAPCFAGNGDGAKGEMLGILLPWLIGERGSAVVSLFTHSGEPGLIAAAKAMGLRPAYRLRESYFLDGERRDRVVLEALNPAWVAKIGDPGAGIESAGEPVGSLRSHAVIQGSGVGLPPGTLLAGERLALRSFEHEDAVRLARLEMADTEFAFAEGRWPVSAASLANSFAEYPKKRFPDEIPLAAVSRETGEIVAYLNLSSLDWVHRFGETGSWIYDPALRGQGLGTEAKHLLLAYAFDWLGLHMVCSSVHIANDRSAAALRKQGYRDAGMSHWAEFGPRGFAHVRYFDLLGSEWRAGWR